MTQLSHPAPGRASFSIPSILAVVCAIASFFFGAFFGLLLAVAAIVLGLIGFLIALAPQVRGGMVSVISIVAGVIGIIAALIKLLGGNL